MHSNCLYQFHHNPYLPESKENFEAHKPNQLGFGWPKLRPGCFGVDFISECASVVFLVVFSLERMHAVFWPLRHRITKTRSYIHIICTAWLFSFTLAITFIISYIGIINQKISTRMLIFLMAVFPLTICLVYCSIWHRHIANNNLTKALLVASLLSVTAWLPVSATLLVSVLCKHCCR